MTAVTTGTLFLQGNDWLLSVPTRSGFRHLRVGRVTGMTRAQAEERVAAGLVLWPTS